MHVNTSHCCDLVWGVCHRRKIFILPFPHCVLIKDSGKTALMWFVLFLNFRYKLNKRFQINSCSDRFHVLGFWWQTAGQHCYLIQCRHNCQCGQHASGFCSRWQDASSLAQRRRPRNYSSSWRTCTVTGEGDGGACKIGSLLHCALSAGLTSTSGLTVCCIKGRTNDDNPSITCDETFWHTVSIMHVFVFMSRRTLKMTMHQTSRLWEKEWVSMSIFYLLLNNLFFKSTGGQW